MNKIPCIMYEEQEAYQWFEDKGHPYIGPSLDTAERGIRFMHSELFSHTPFYVLYGCENIPEDLPPYMEYFELDLDGDHFSLRVLQEDKKQILRSFFDKDEKGVSEDTWISEMEFEEITPEAFLSKYGHAGCFEMARRLKKVAMDDYDVAVTQDNYGLVNIKKGETNEGN